MTETHRRTTSDPDRAEHMADALIALGVPFRVDVDRDAATWTFIVYADPVPPDAATQPQRRYMGAS